MNFSEWTQKNRKLRDFEELKKSIKKLVNGRKIVAMLSGGGDSAVAISILDELDLDVLCCVHFYHDWSWDITRKQAKKIAKSLDIPIEFNYIGDELKRRIMGSKGKSICRICKDIMKLRCLGIAKKYKADIIATGDTASEKVSGAIMQYLRDNGYGYEKMELTPVPKKIAKEGINFLRPLIRLRREDVEEFVKYYDLQIEKVGEANKKQREGCPIQYCDPKVRVTEELLDETFRANKIATAIAREHGFRASVFMLSGATVTIPDDYTYIKLIEDSLTEGGFEIQKRRYNQHYMQNKKRDRP